MTEQTEFGTEINALFNLWDEFAPVLEQSLFHETDLTMTHFYKFPIGTNINVIMDWFHKQNHYFCIDMKNKNGRREFKVYVNRDIKD